MIEETNIKNLVSIVPERKLESNEEIIGIFKVDDKTRNCYHIGFKIKRWETASQGTEEWIGANVIKI